MGVGVSVVIIKLKANLSSTSHLTSQLELSLATSWGRAIPSSGRLQPFLTLSPTGGGGGGDIKSTPMRK